MQDGVEDVGKVVVGKVDGVEFVEFREGFLGDVCDVVVGNVQDF